MPAPRPPHALLQAIQDRAIELGFDALACADATVPLDADYARFQAFLEAGKHGEMGYLARHGAARHRVDGPAILEGARSVICLAKRYARADEAMDPPLAKRVARYARGRDYHNHLKKRLRKLAAFVASLEEGARARAICDVEPVLERAWAARSGLGFIGKNGLLIVPGGGSYALLGEVVTTIALPPGVPIPERCGSCVACLEACPTQAFDAPFVLDARRCIAYLTIERRSPLTTDELAELDGWVFGCDRCQEVCPYNRTQPPKRADPAFLPHAGFTEVEEADFDELDEPRFAAAFEGSPLRRAGLGSLRRAMKAPRRGEGFKKRTL